MCPLNIVTKSENRRVHPHIRTDNRKKWLGRLKRRLSILAFFMYQASFYDSPISKRLDKDIAITHRVINRQHLFIPNIKIIGIIYAM